MKKAWPLFAKLLLVAPVLVFPGCAMMEEAKKGSASKVEQKRLAALRDQAAVEHSLYRSVANWKKNTYKNKALVEAATPDRVALEISLNEQRGLLLVDGAIAMDFPVATGKKSHPTPAGRYAILARHKQYASNLYGKIYDAEGTVVVADADTRTDPIPEGGRFEGASMPYWMRLTTTGVGLHVGYVPGRPASHGCIRLRTDTAKTLFSLTKIGTPVVIDGPMPSLASRL
ncbi:MAG: L,D-transpeptidase [Terrimicrobiaceae bacterium]